MDTSCFMNINYCFLFGLISIIGCHATHLRKKDLHMDHVWKGVDISVESPGPSFIIQPLGAYPPSTLFLQRPISVGYAGMEPSILSTSYGPFQTRQTLMVSDREADSDFFVRAHLIDREIHRHTPSVRVLFHLEKHRLSTGNHKSKACLKAEIKAMDLISTGYCIPKGHPAACLAEVDIPLAWKSEGNNSSDGPVELKVSYSVLPSSENYRCSSRDDEIDPYQEGDGIEGEFLATVPVITEDDDDDYTRVTEDRFVHMDIPKAEIGLHEKFDVPIMVHRQAECTLRAKIKQGIRLTKIKYKDVMRASQMSMVRSRGTFGMATAEKQVTGEENEESEEMPVVMAMEFEILNQTGSARQITWRVDCTKGQDQFASKYVTEIAGSQDQLKEFVPLIKSKELVNTAVLGSGRVHYPLRVIAVNHGGDTSVITDKVQCRSADVEVVKVREDCTAVLVNGSESRGSDAVDIEITYRGSSVNLTLRVWMPELPLTVSLSDDHLSLVKRWKVAHKKGQGNSENDAVSEDGGGCQLNYQTATVEVLTRFYVTLGEGGEESKRYFSGHDALQFITHLVTKHIRVKDHRVALSDGRMVTGVEPGDTMVQVIHPHTKEVLGEKKVRVLSDKVEIVDLKVTMVTGMSLTFGSINTKDNIFGYNLVAHEGFVTNHQEAFLYVTITYDDLTVVALHDLDPTTYNLVVSSNHNEVMANSPDSTLEQPSVITTGQGTTAVIISFLPASQCQRKRKENCIIIDAFNVDVTYNSSHPLLNEIVSGNPGEPWLRFSPGVSYVDPGVVRTDISQYYVRQLPPREENDCNQDVTIIPFSTVDWTPGGNTQVVKGDPNHSSNFTGQSETDPSQRGDTSEKNASMSIIEIVMYVILAIFGVAVLFFLINFLVFVVRYLKRKKPALSDGIHPQSWIMLGVDWEKRQSNFPLPSDESFQLQESTEGSGREDMSSTMSGASVPRGAGVDLEEPNEGEPLIHRLNNGVLVRGAGLHGESEVLEAPPNVRWPRQTEDLHEVEPLPTSRTVLDGKDSENMDCVAEGDRAFPNDRTHDEPSTSRARENALTRSRDFVLENLEDMQETKT